LVYNILVHSFWNTTAKITDSLLEMAKLSKRNKMNRKSRKARKTRGGTRCWSGGSPASVTDTSMQAASRLSLAQGGDYANIHKGQHGGFIAPVGSTGMLDDSLRAIARVTPLDQSVAAASGMQDGGARRRKGKKSRKASKSKKSRKAPNHRALMAMLKKLQKQRGGMPYALTQAQDYSTPGMLLTPSAERAALGGMNPEWRLASDPTSFTPK